MRYLILGLGIYGSNLARDLTDMGHEVIGVDQSQYNVDAIKDYISTVYVIDVTEESSLALLPLNNVDLVIVTIGENFGASIKVVAMLKKLRVKHIFARAIDTLHESILQGFEIDRILTPEQRAARDLTFEMALGTKVQTLSVDEETFVVKFKAPQALVGIAYAELALEQKYKVRLVSLARTIEHHNLLGVKQPMLESRDVRNLESLGKVLDTDVMVCLGTRKAFFSLFKSLTQ